MAVEVSRGMQSIITRRSFRYLFTLSYLTSHDSPSAKLKHIENTIEEYRKQIDNSKTENYGFASLAAVPYAHIVANILEDKHLKNTDITLASNPRDIVSGFCFCDY